MAVSLLHAGADSQTAPCPQQTSVSLICSLFSTFRSLHPSNNSPQAHRHLQQRSSTKAHPPLQPSDSP